MSTVTDNLLTIDEAITQYFGSRVSSFAVRRWIARGVGSPPVKLRALRMGGRYYLSTEFCEEFMQALSDPTLFCRKRETERVELAKQRLRRAGA